MAEPSPQLERSSLPRPDVFVGRQREMDTLKTALESCLAGSCQIVMLAGEPGIGKTRTAQELASYAEDRRAQVLWGWSHEAEGAPPYWPWVRPIRSYVQNIDSERMKSEMGPAAAVIAEIIPEIRAKLPGLETPPNLGPEQARFRLFDAITTFIKNASQSQPLVLILDDLHWADKSSLLLLQFLAQESVHAQPGRLLVVGCYRDMELSRQHPLYETLAKLSRSTEDRFQSVLLRGLDQDDTARFIEARIGIKPTKGLAEALYSHTEGNPFFITEIIRLLSESGHLTADFIGKPEALRIPERVRKVIGQRLNRLSNQCNQALTTASVIGREFDFRLLNNIVDAMSEAQLLQAVDEAVSSSLIEEVPGRIDYYQFSHALIQQTLAEELTTSRRVRLHARIGVALEAVYGDDAEAHAAELAHHFAEAETTTGPDKLVRYSLMAGERALGSYAHEEALTHFERALVARDITLSGTEAASDEDAAALLFGLARAQSATVEAIQLVEVFATLSRAFEYYVKAGNVAQAVAAAEFPMAPPAYRIPGIAQLMARALTLVPADSHEAGRLLSRYGGILGVAECDYGGAQQALVRAAAIARREGDVPLEVQTLTYAAVVSGMHLQWQESVDNGLRAIELATVDENPFSEVFSRYWTAQGLLFMGDLDAARTHALVLRDLAERRSTSRLLASRGFVSVTWLSCLEGDWKAGREYSDRGLELSPLDPQLLLPRVLLEHETGESAQGEAFLEQLLQAMRRAGPDQLLASTRASTAIAAIARITGIPDRLEIAEAAAEAVLSEQFVTPNYTMYAKVGLALLAVQKGDQSPAKGHYAYFLGQRSTMIWTLSSVDRLLGLLSHTMGNLDRAAAHFEDALAFCRKAGYRPEMAWVCCDYADALVERNDFGDRENALSLCDEALAITTELGMHPLMERVIERSDRITAQLPASPANPAGLSAREVEVLRLLASGSSNAVLAAELVLSVRTVERHIANVYLKTNSHNRAEATAFAFTHGLMSST